MAIPQQLEASLKYAHFCIPGGLWFEFFGGFLLVHPKRGQLHFQSPGFIFF
jgi:hypothetical protein